MTVHKNALPNGTVLQQYKIESMLAHGGFGIVYLARHVQLDEQVVVKEFLPSEVATREGTTVHPLSNQEKDDYADGLQRFLDEAKQLVQFKAHPNIVSCRDFFSANGTAYLVMDYENGMSLGDLLKARQGQGLTEEEMMRIMLPLLDGLRFVHNKGVLHRDIKPGNIYIRREDEQPVLIDFGAAKQNFSKHSKSKAPYSPGYAAFEQVSDDGELGPWTDIYAIGAVMWRAVSGQNPIEVEKRMAAVVRQSADPLVPASQLGAGRFSDKLLSIIDKCLNLTEQQRFQNVDELIQALQGDTPVAAAPESIQTAKPSAGPQSDTYTSNLSSGAATQHTSGEKKKKPALIALMLLALIGSVGAGGYFIKQYQDEAAAAQAAAKKAADELAAKKKAEEDRIAAEKKAEEDRIAEQKRLEAKRLADKKAREDAAAKAAAKAKADKERLKRERYNKWLASINVANTVWTGVDSDGDFYEYHFKPSGVLNYRSPSGFYTTKASWKQNGSTVYLYTGNKYATRKGKIKGSKMSGNASNKGGRTWTWKATKQTARWRENVASIAGTVWYGNELDGKKYQYHFKRGGKLHYRTPSGLYKKATWKQRGSEIYYEMNNKYAQRRGIIVGNKMMGNAWNKKGKKWTFKATRQYGKYSIENRSTTPSVANTMWAGTDSDGDYYEYYLWKGGVMHYRSPAGYYKERATWVQKGNKVYLYTGNKYATRKGTISGSRMSGSASNKGGRSWTWKATKKKKLYGSPSSQSSLSVPSVSGTMWAGTDSDGDYYEYHLKRGGVMHYRSPAGMFKQNASWVQRGSTIYLYTGNKYATRKGTIRGNKMSGTASNKQGRTWTWKATKKY